LEDAVVAATVSADRILRELADLWVAAGQEQAEGGLGVLRACAMTLIVLAEETEDMEALGETIAALMPEYPARTILVRLGGTGAPALAERVYSQCWMPFGQRRQICCERIEITASEASLADLPSILPPLAAPDLPVLLWWRSARLLGTPGYRKLAAMADKAIVDSSGLEDEEAALPMLVEMAQGEPERAGRARPLLGDLSWTLLTRWREMLSGVFESRECQGRLPEISNVVVAFAGVRPPVFAWYMGAWVANALSDAGAHAYLTWQPRPDLAGRALHVELTGGDFRVSLERHDDRLSIEAGGLSHCTNLPQPTDYLLMREELGIVRRDPLFERTLATAARLAAASIT
jgi:glucose-6-phosphate dehydrogenase assembly protein OpcA